MQDPEANVAVTETWLSSVFPEKPAAKIKAWVHYLLGEEFDSVKELQELSDTGWKSVELPIAIKDALRAHVSRTSSASSPGSSLPAATTPTTSAFLHPPAEQPTLQPQPSTPRCAVPSTSPTTLPPELPLITQLDCVVMDISQSMKARSAIDPLKTREDMSKLLFHTMMDKLVSLELSHAVGLISFGQVIHPIGVTREYECFHDELGRLDAREHQTSLYDAIYEAAQMLDAYAKEHKASLRPAGHADCKNGQPGCVRRVFVLTDGADNASKRAAWQVARHLQQSGVVLDVIPVAGPNATLQAMAEACGGYCLKVSSEEQGCALFERQAILALADRPPTSKLPPTISSSAALDNLKQNARLVESVPVAATPKAVFAPTMRASQVQAALTSSPRKSTAAMKRMLKEYKEMKRAPSAGVEAFISGEDLCFWKLIIAGPEGTPYAGFYFLLSVAFPDTYPMKPPRINFVTPVFHPNVNNDGRICIDALQSAWTPALTVPKVAQAIRVMMEHPNTEDALDAFKAQLYMQERPRYLKEASAYTEKHAFASLETLKAKFGIMHDSA